MRKGGRVVRCIRRASPVVHVHVDVKINDSLYIYMYLTYLTSNRAELMGERFLSLPLVAAVTMGWVGPGLGNGGRLSD